MIKPLDPPEKQQEINAQTNVSLGSHSTIIVDPKLQGHRNKRH